MSFLNDPKYDSIRSVFFVFVFLVAGYFLFMGGENRGLVGRVISGTTGVNFNPSLNGIKTLWNTTNNVSCVLTEDNPQGSGSRRYCDVIFDDSEISMMSHKYSTATNVDTDDTIDLYFDRYYPTNDQVTNRPAALCMPGGGGTRTSGGIIEWCKNRFAMRGYVGFTVDYRGAQSLEGFTATNQKYAQSDIHSAIRFIRNNATAWGIDPNKIVLMGTSAGGIAAVSANISGDNLEETYFDDDKVNTDNPGQPSWSCASITEPGASNSLVTNNLINGIEGPNFAYHGTDDFKIPYSGVENMTEAMKDLGVPSTLMSFDGAGHSLGVYEDTIEADVIPKLFDWIITQGCPHDYMGQTKL